MPEISLSINKMSIKMSHKPIAYSINNFGEAGGKDLVDQLEAFFKKNEPVGGLEAKEKTFSFDRTIEKNVEKRDGHPYFKYWIFSVNYGEYGTTQKIKDITTGETVHIQKPVESGERAFHVAMIFPYGQEMMSNLVFLENIGNMGVKTILTDKIKQFFKVGGYTVSMGSVSDYAYIERLMKEKPLQKLKLIRYTDAHDSMVDPYTKKELTFTSPSFDGLQGMMSSFLRIGKIGLSGIAEIDDFNPTDMKFVLDMGNSKKKTIGISQIGTVGVVEYITDEIVKNEDGLPTDESFKRAIWDRYEAYIKFCGR